MKKSDLKTGMRVQFRNGDIYMVIKDIDGRNGHQDIAFINFDGFMFGSSYTEDLTRFFDEPSEYDIMKVYSVDKDERSFLKSCILDLNQKHLIWERKDYKEMTVSEIEKILGYKIKIVNNK